MTGKLSNEFLEQLTGLLEDKPITELNQLLKAKTGVSTFFRTYQNYEIFKEKLGACRRNSEKSKDMGDFQTPKQLADKICEYLTSIGVNPLCLVEPTCGSGNFVISALEFFPQLKYIYCIELQEEYEWLFKLSLLGKALEGPIKSEIEFHKDNIFTHRFSNTFLRYLKAVPGRILILGNPPWVTNTELSELNSDNIPLKSNIKGYKGIEAITGRGNFDIAEYILIQLVRQFSKYKGQLAMLCKTSVIKNIVKDMEKLGMKLSRIRSLQIDAKKEFDINADAALFLANFGYDSQATCIVSSLYQPNLHYNIFGWIDGKFVSHIENYRKYRFLDGKSEFVWRQGVKHDAIKIMVLEERGNGLYRNGLNEDVEIEADYLYPFVKGADLKKKVIKTCEKKVIITQTSLQDDTNKIAAKYPKLWKYLLEHSEALDHRKSYIYRNRPRFAIFGIGPYAFHPYKVAISGFHKTPTFSLLFPINDKPVIPDDTCYYLSFKEFINAFFTWVLLNTPEVQEFLLSIAFLDSKRPFTKEKLMRITLGNLINHLSFEELMQFYQETLRPILSYEFNAEQFLRYKTKNFPQAKSLLSYF
ncbi:MAG: methyltransferase [Candidatus Helarchaeota archaeon]